MRTPRHILPAALATCAAALALPSLASATDFCVNGPTGCTGTAVPTAGFKQALEAAETNGTDDRFILAPGTYENDALAYNSLEKVEIIGAGRAETVLRASPTSPALSLSGNGDSRVSKLTLQPRGDSNVGVLLSAARAVDVDVKPEESADSLQAVVLMSGGARLVDSTVKHGGPSAGVETSGSGGTVSGSTIELPHGAGILGAAAATDVRHSIFRTSNGVIGAAGHTSVSDTLIDLHLATGGIGAFASTGTTFSDSAPVLDLDRVSIVAPNFGPGVGIGVGSAASGAGKTSVVNLRNSVISGFDDTFLRRGENGGVADLHAERSVYLPASPGSDSGPGKLSETNHLQLSPHFVDPAAADFRLAADSPLIDAGSADLADDAVDAAGKPRRSDGNGDCSRVADIGAFEFQGSSVKAAARAAAASVQAGQPATFDSDGSCIPGPGAPKVTWSFDDGASSEGPTAAHAFATPGRHTATATVSDGEGHFATASAPVEVEAAPAPVVTPPKPKAAAPRITSLRVKGAKVRFKLSRDAKVDIRFAKVLKHGVVKRIKARLKVNGREGANRVRLPRGLRHLRAGSYRATAVATAAGTKSKPRSARFKVAKTRR